MPARRAKRSRAIRIAGARTHNLKNISCTIPQAGLTVITGVSGSGKSSLAFDTLYAEGQRRYVDSLSTYSRQFLERLERPDVDLIEGVQPAIAIEQKNTVKNARSTVGTATEINDYLRLLYAHVGQTQCPNCRHPVRRDSVESSLQVIEQSWQNTLAIVVSPLTLGSKTNVRAILADLRQEGYFRVYLDGLVIPFEELRITAVRRARCLPLLIDRLRITPGESRLAEALSQAFQVSGGLAQVFTPQGEVRQFSTQFACGSCGREFPEPQPQMFSFNSPLGACPTCQGFGRTVGIDLAKVIPDHSKSLAEGCVVPWRRPAYTNFLAWALQRLRRAGVPTKKPFAKLTPRQQRIVIEGGEGFPGVNGFFAWLERRKYRLYVRVMLSKFRGYTSCADCGGSRLQPAARQVFVAARSIDELCRISLRELREFVDNPALTPHEEEVAGRIMRELRNRVAYMVDVGLGYLTLHRQTRTLSGGEAQRINLAFALGSALTDTLYVLDEPTVGLHARDTNRLLGILQALKRLGNTIVLVEHDRGVITAADHLIDLGPGAGRRGGRVVFEGALKRLHRAKNSLTGAWLRQPPALNGQQPRRPTGRLTIRKARANNLKSLTVKIPLGVLACVTGVSGAGKSTLVNHVLYDGYRRRFDPSVEAGACDRIDGLEAIDDIIMIDQSPIGRSLRSNPATYMKVFDDIRKLFASTPEAKQRGLKPGHFSFNVAGGRCEACKGAGRIVIEMHFLEDVSIPCEQCGGLRFNSRVLEVRYRGLNIHQVLQLTVQEALDIFDDQQAMARRLTVCRDVGLDYLTLGQPTSTLCGGEAQRLKLAHAMALGQHRRCQFIFDEPTTGLHLADIAVLLTALSKLLDDGHSVLVVEHNLDFIAHTDALIDLGPEGGEEGGRLVASGTIEQIMATPSSHTGQALRVHFGKI